MGLASDPAFAIYEEGHRPNDPPDLERSATAGTVVDTATGAMIIVEEASAGDPFMNGVDVSIVVAVKRRPKATWSLSLDMDHVTKVRLVKSGVLRIDYIRDYQVSGIPGPSKEAVEFRYKIQPNEISGSWKRVR